MTQTAWEALDRAMKAGEVATLEEARQLLAEQGVPYKSVAGVSSLLIRHKVKLKTGRPRHRLGQNGTYRACPQHTDEVVQAAFKNFASKLADSAQKGKRLRVFAFDEARFGLKSWHRRRWCPFGFRPPWVVQDKYQWFWLYTAVEPATGDSFSLYLPSLDSTCLQVFLEHLKAAYPDDALLLVMDQTSSHRSTRVTWPQDAQPLLLPSYSPQLNPAERCFQELRKALSNRLFNALETLQVALTEALRPFWHDKPRLAQLTGYSWWLEALQKL